MNEYSEDIKRFLIEATSAVTPAAYISLESRMDEIAKRKDRWELLGQIDRSLPLNHPQRASQEILDFIRIRNAPLEGGRYFHTSTWKTFKTKVETWKMQNPGWWNKDHDNYQEALALNLNLYLRNGNASISRRNEAMRHITCLFDVIDDSPFRQYLKINEAREAVVAYRDSRKASMGRGYHE